MAAVDSLRFVATSISLGLGVAGVGMRSRGWLMCLANLLLRLRVRYAVVTGFGDVLIVGFLPRSVVEQVGKRWDGNNGRCCEPAVVLIDGRSCGDRVLGNPYQGRSLPA